MVCQMLKLAMERDGGGGPPEGQESCGGASWSDVCCMTALWPRLSLETARRCVVTCGADDDGLRCLIVR